MCKEVWAGPERLGTAARTKELEFDEAWPSRPLVAHVQCKTNTEGGVLQTVLIPPELSPASEAVRTVP